MSDTSTGPRPAPWALRAILTRRPENSTEWALAVGGAGLLYSLAAAPLAAAAWLVALMV